MTAATTYSAPLVLNPALIASTHPYDPDAWRKPRRWLRRLFAVPTPARSLRPTRNRITRRKA